MNHCQRARWAEADSVRQEALYRLGVFFGVLACVVLPAREIRPKLR